MVMGSLRLCIAMSVCRVTGLRDGTSEPIGECDECLTAINGRREADGEVLSIALVVRRRAWRDIVCLC